MTKFRQGLWSFVQIISNLPGEYKECWRDHEGREVEECDEGEQAAQQHQQHPPQHREEGPEVHEEPQPVHTQLVPGVALQKVKR